METPLLQKNGSSSRSFRRRVMLSLTILSVCMVIAIAMKMNAISSSTSWISLLTMKKDLVSSSTADGDADGNNLASFISFLPPSMQKMLNTSVDPCDDFHDFACGTFEEDTPIPKDKSSFSFSWDGDAKKISHELRNLMSIDQGKVGNYYRACMDTETVEEIGLTPVQPWLALVESVNNLDTLAIAVAKLHMAEVSNFFDWFLVTDNQFPTRELLMIDQGGLDLPDSSYYTDTSARNLQHISVYKQYLSSLFQLYGHSAEKAALMVTDVIDIETKLASHSGDDNALDSSPRYNLISLEQGFPNFKWRSYFAAVGQSDIASEYDQIGVTSPKWLKAFDDMLSSYPLEKIKTYIKSHLMFNVSPLLGKEFFAINLIVDNDLYGVSAHPKRDEKCVGATKAALPFMVSKMFVEHYFPLSAKQIATSMLEHIRDAFRADLETLAWMTEISRAAALDKLNHIFFEVGYPAVWPEYHFPVYNNTYFDNSLASSTWRSQRKFERLRHPVERHRWTMAPATVNAYYDNGVNGVFVPAGLLQPPFFDWNMPLAHNYGSAGAIMAHELTHGFDNSGRKYDAECRKRQWWDQQTIDQFEQRAACIANWYNDFQVVGTHVAGNNTLGENIADIGGLKMAHSAYLTEEAKQVATGADLNHRRLFWTSFAQTWCGVQRNRVTKLNILTDVHSPDKFRILGPLQENPDFAADFQCPVGSKMNPAQRCDLW